MKRYQLYFLIIYVFIFYNVAYSQRNCNVYKMEGDSCRYKACTYLENAPKYFQLRKEFHEIFDKALEICPEYSDAYRAKSVAYLKTGDFITWKILMDKAVDISPKDHLGYSGWCKFQFLRDYEGAITDIESLDRLVKYDIGYSKNGTYHLNVVKALCYKMIGKKDKAIKLIENHIRENKSTVDFYDYLHLGVLYQEIGAFKKSLSCFQQQSKEYNCAENAYYTALSYKKLANKEKYILSLQKADSLYNANSIMFDPYTHQIDKVFHNTITTKLKTALKQ